MDYSALSPTDYGNMLGRHSFTDPGIRALWSGMPRIAGPAFTVQLAAGDNLMLHAAIYEAPPGSIIVADAEDDHYAVAGGNVCAVAQARGIRGFVVDGVIRDLGEIREMQFPVFARGVFPVPGKKQVYHPLGQPITCGGAPIKTGDIVVADEEGIAFIPEAEASAIFARAKAKHDLESQTSLSEWRQAHQEKIEEAIRQGIQTRV